MAFTAPLRARDPLDILHRHRAGQDHQRAGQAARVRGEVRHQRPRRDQCGDRDRRCVDGFDPDGHPDRPGGDESDRG